MRPLSLTKRKISLTFSLEILIFLPSLVWHSFNKTGRRIDGYIV